MQTFASVFMEGGIWVWLILLFSLLHGIPVLAQFIACKKADFSGYLWAGLGGILVLGWIGTGVGMIQGFEALAVASPEQKQSLLVTIIAIALSPTIVAMLLVIPGLFFTGIAASLARNLAPRPLRERGEEG